MKKKIPQYQASKPIQESGVQRSPKLQGAGGGGYKPRHFESIPAPQQTEYRKHNSPDVNRVRSYGSENGRKELDSNKIRNTTQTQQGGFSPKYIRKDTRNQPGTQSNQQSTNNYQQSTAYQQSSSTYQQQYQQSNNYQPSTTNHQQSNHVNQQNGSNQQQQNGKATTPTALGRKQLQKTASVGSLPLPLQQSQSQSQTHHDPFLSEQNEQYMKLHDKLNFIQEKIADMKRNLLRKKQEKQKIMEAKRRKERERQEERKRQQQKEKEREKNQKQKEKATKKTDIKQFITQVPEHKQLHTFDKNPYSPNHDIYYISQVIKGFQDQKSLARQHLLTSLHILKILQNSKYATDAQMKERQVNLPKRQGFQGKKCVVFDLDQTLIHCNDTLTPPYDIKLPITFPTGQVIEAGINIRPHAQQILRNLSHHFEVIVFTASHSCYANVVLDWLDPQGEFVHHRLYREHCYQTPEGMYCKDLRVLNRDLSDVVLVDNAAYSYSAQLENGIPILPYYHGKTDFELNALEAYLMKMVNVKDVRTINKNTFQLHRYRHYYNDPERLVNELYLAEEKELEKA